MDQVRLGINILVTFYSALCAIKVIDWLTKRSSLGAVLWARPGGTPYLSLVGFLTFVGLLSIADGVYSKDVKALILGASLILIGVTLFFPVGRMRVRENGLEVGLVVLRWKEITRWEWSPATGAPRDGQFSLWTTSPWRFFYVLRPSRPIQTGVRFTDEIHAALEVRASLRHRADPCP